MSYWILTATGHVISWTTVQRITNLELLTDEVKANCKDHDQQVADIRRAYLNIVKATTANKTELDIGGSSINKGMSITICEGTGHAGVGSVVGTGNARVAEELGADVVLVANGGLGRAFDELQLNRAMFIVSEQSCHCQTT